MSQVATATVQEVPRPNALTLETMLVKAKELGGQEGIAKDVMIKFDLLVLNSAFQGQLDLQPDKHGTGVSDAARLGKAYYEGRNGAVIFDVKAPNQRKLVSNIAKMIKLGTSPHWGVDQPIAIVNDLLVIHKKLRETPAKGVKVEDAHNALMKMATLQLKRPTALVSTDELKACCIRPEADPKTTEEKWQALQKAVKKLNDPCPEATTVLTAINKRVTALVKARTGN